MLARIRTAYYFCFHPLTSSDNPFPASANAIAVIIATAGKPAKSPLFDFAPVPELPVKPIPSKTQPVLKFFRTVSPLNILFL